MNRLLFPREGAGAWRWWLIISAPRARSYRPGEGKAMGVMPEPGMEVWMEVGFVGLVGAVAIILNLTGGRVL